MFKRLASPAIAYTLAALLIAPATLFASDAPQPTQPGVPAAQQQLDHSAVQAPPADPAAQAQQPQSQPQPSQPQPAPARDAATSAPVAVAASPGSVAIKNFKYAPAAITVNVGDTITWSNDDTVAHSATAKDGSFDTGLFSKGESRSNKFTQAGTFAYICSVHPYMHGTVRVVASSSGGGGGSSGSGDSKGSSSSSGSASGRHGSSARSSGSSGSSTAGLPRTGMDAGLLAALGLVLLGVGALLHRRAARRPA